MVGVSIFSSDKDHIIQNWQSVILELVLFHVCSCLIIGMGFPGGSVAKNLPTNSGDLRDVVWSLGQGSPRGGNGNLIQYSRWENPMHRAEPDELQSMESKSATTGRLSTGIGSHWHRCLHRPMKQRTQGQGIYLWLWAENKTEKDTSTCWDTENVNSSNYQVTGLKQSSLVS